MFNTIPKHDSGYKKPPPTVRTPTVFSSHANPNAISFLDFPSELRNQVYVYLFKRKEPIIHTGPTPHGEAISIKPPHNIGPWISMLRTCRQVFHEAAGMLYIENVFLIAGGRYDVAACFVQSLGTQSNFLRKIIIDVSTLHSYNSYSGKINVNEIELLPLLRLSWVRPDIARRIEFKRTGRSLSQRSSHLHLVPDVAILRDLFNSLGVEDSLQLKRHGRFESLIDRVKVNTNLIGLGKVHYPSPASGLVDVLIDYRPFRVSEILHPGEGRSLQIKWTKPYHKRNRLHALPLHVRMSIFSCVIASMGRSVFIDLDRQIAHGLAFNLMRLVIEHVQPCDAFIIKRVACVFV